VTGPPTDESRPWQGGNRGNIDADSLADIADIALDLGQVVLWRDLVFIPDLVAIEATANGNPPPVGPYMRRHADGRTVLVLRGLEDGS
jgi:hypothetical protein